MRLVALSFASLLALAAGQQVSITTDDFPVEFSIGAPSGIQIDPEDAGSEAAAAAAAAAANAALGANTVTKPNTGSSSAPNTGSASDPIATADVAVDNGSLSGAVSGVEPPKDVPYDAADDMHTIVTGKVPPVDSPYEAADDTHTVHTPDEVPADLPFEAVDGHVVDSEPKDSMTNTASAPDDASAGATASTGDAAHDVLEGFAKESEASATQQTSETQQKSDATTQAAVGLCAALVVAAVL